MTWPMRTPHLAWWIGASHLAWSVRASHLSRSMRASHPEGLGAGGPLLLLPVVGASVAEHHLPSGRAGLGGGRGEGVYADEGAGLIKQRRSEAEQLGQAVLGRGRGLTLRSVGRRGASTSGLVMVSRHWLMHRRTTTQIGLGGCLGQPREGHGARVGNPWTAGLAWASCGAADGSWSPRASLGVRVGSHALLRGPGLSVGASRAWVSL